MDLSQRLESLEQTVKDVLVLLQQQAKTCSVSHGAASPLDPIINRLNGLSQDILQLKEDYGCMNWSVSKTQEKYVDNAMSLPFFLNMSPPVSSLIQKRRGS